MTDGRWLIAGGEPANVVLASSELYDIGLGFSAPVRPQISTATPQLSNDGGSLTLSGLRFQGIGDASSGNGQDSSSGFPIVELRSLSNGQSLFLGASSWSATAFTSTSISGFAAGYALVTVYADGVPGVSAITRVQNPVAPVFAGTVSTVFQLGLPNSFQLFATGDPAPGFSETGVLPPGVSLSAAGALSGTPTAGTAGICHLSLTASNGVLPNATESFTLTVSTPPSVGLDAFTVAQDAPASFAVARLLLKDSDADGDALSIVSVSTISTHGATIAVSGGTLTYTPARLRWVR